MYTHLSEIVNNKQYNILIDDISNLSYELININKEYDINKNIIDEYEKYKTSINKIIIKFLNFNNCILIHV